MKERKAIGSTMLWVILGVLGFMMIAYFVFSKWGGAFRIA